MTLLNVSLCLPELEVIALREAHTIAATTQRFIVPDRAFVLMPCQASSDRSDIGTQYQSQWTQRLSVDLSANSEIVEATHWAQCVFCQQISDEEAIAALAERTIWTKSALLNRWQERNRLFVSLLRVYKLQEPISEVSTPTCDSLYKFLPLPSYVEAQLQNLVLADAEFDKAKQRLLEPNQSPDPTEGRQEAEESIEDVLSTSNWIEKISETGHSSNGHTFEKLIRKALLELGFSNSTDQSIDALDPKATGGAGGLDFYANHPYKIVGECKATKTGKVKSDATAQIVRLGLKNLEADEYLDCIKIVVAGGRLTSSANQTAEGHRINILRPETMERLVKSKIDFEDDFDIYQLKSHLEAQPFGEAADQKLNRYLDWCSQQWLEKQNYLKLVEQIMQSLKELSYQSIAHSLQDFSALEVRAHHNAKYQPLVTTSKVERILESQLYAQKSEINRRQHQNGFVGYYLR